MAKPAKTTTAPQEKPHEDPLPLLQTLAMLTPEPGVRIPIRVFSRGDEVLGYQRLSELEKPSIDIVLSVLAIWAMKLYSERQGFGEVADFQALLDNELESLPSGTIHTIGVAQLKSGLYVPVSAKIEDGKVAGTAALFSMPLGRMEALSVIRGKFDSFFLQKRVFV